MAIKATLILTVVVLLFTVSAAATSYTNHTVGDSAGWFFNSSTNSSSTNYTSWSAAQTFNLGDFLIFSTSTNQTVIQTYNETTYRSCSIDDASEDDTFQYNGGSTEFGQPLTIPVPLTIEGSNYFFSAADDGIQCLQGMAFEILVNRGLGLPPSLNQPPPPHYVEPPASDTASSPPVTITGRSPSLENASSDVAPNAFVVICALLFGAAALPRVQLQV